MTIGEAIERSRDEQALVAALRAGDEQAFVALVDRYTPAMRRLALGFVRSHAVADEVVQEAWLNALRGLDRFEGRSSVSTWLFRICANVAKTRAEREGRTIPFSSLASETEDGEPSVDPGRFQGPAAATPATGRRFRRSGPRRGSCRPRHASSSRRRSRRCRRCSGS